METSFRESCDSSSNLVVYVEHSSEDEIIDVEKLTEDEESRSENPVYMDEMIISSSTQTIVKYEIDKVPETVKQEDETNIQGPDAANVQKYATLIQLLDGKFSEKFEEKLEIETKLLYRFFEKCESQEQYSNQPLEPVCRVQEPTQQQWSSLQQQLQQQSHWQSLPTRPHPVNINFTGMAANNSLSTEIYQQSNQHYSFSVDPLIHGDFNNDHSLNLQQNHHSLLMLQHRMQELQIANQLRTHQEGQMANNLAHPFFQDHITMASSALQPEPDNVRINNAFTRQPELYQVIYQPSQTVAVEAVNGCYQQDQQCVPINAMPQHFMYPSVDGVHEQPYGPGGGHPNSFHSSHHLNTELWAPHYYNFWYK